MPAEILNNHRSGVPRRTVRPACARLDAETRQPIGYGGGNILVGRLNPELQP